MKKGRWMMWILVALLIIGLIATFFVMPETAQEVLSTASEPLSSGGGMSGGGMAGGGVP